MLAPLTFLRGGVLAPFQLGTGVHRSGKTPSIRRGIATKPGLKEFQISHLGLSLVGGRGELEANAKPFGFAEVMAFGWSQEVIIWEP